MSRFTLMGQSKMAIYTRFTRWQQRAFWYSTHKVHCLLCQIVFACRISLKWRLLADVSNFIYTVKFRTWRTLCCLNWISYLVLYGIIGPCFYGIVYLLLVNTVFCEIVSITFLRPNNRSKIPISFHISPPPISVRWILSKQALMDRSHIHELPQLQVSFIDAICLPIYTVSISWPIFSFLSAYCDCRSAFLFAWLEWYWFVTLRLLVMEFFTASDDGNHTIIVSNSGLVVNGGMVF